MTEQAFFSPEEKADCLWLAICEIHTSCRSESSNLMLGRLDKQETKHYVWYTLLNWHVICTFKFFLITSVSRPALCLKPLLDTMIWMIHHAGTNSTKFWQRINLVKYTIVSTLKVSRYVVGHSDSIPSLSWHKESLRSSMSLSPLRENETFSRSEGIA